MRDRRVARVGRIVMMASLWLFVGAALVYATTLGGAIVRNWQDEFWDWRWWKFAGEEDFGENTPDGWPFERLGGTQPASWSWRADRIHRADFADWPKLPDQSASISIATWGFPFLSLRVTLVPDEKGRMTAGNDGWFVETSQSMYVVLPLRPIWPGFALNTLFYAAIAWGLWQLPLALRRRSRSKKGLCVRCGYDLKGLAPGATCPECGHASGVRG